MVKEIVVFAAGFAAGVLYSSNVYKENPNKVFSHMKDSFNDAGKKFSDRVRETINPSAQYQAYQQ